jgi:hypothetical protein
VYTCKRLIINRLRGIKCVSKKSHPYFIFKIRLQAITLPKVLMPADSNLLAAVLAGIKMQNDTLAYIPAAGR